MQRGDAMTNPWPQPAPSAGFATVAVPGTCGELVQGQFNNGTDFLVTLPVDLWSTVRVEIIPESQAMPVYPADRTKTQQAARLMLNVLGYPDAGARIWVTSELPVGKGMASSTADIVAACRAIAAALDRSATPEMISQIAGEIEPSDGVMYPGVVCYNHRQCRLIDHLGTMPPLEILVIDLGGEVDTLAFNTRPKDYNDTELEAFQRAYELVAEGVSTGDVSLIGRAATISARVNQRLLPKPCLEDFIQISETHGAYGLSIAHSGTTIGLLFERGAGRAIRRAREAILESIDPALHLWTVWSL
jgi:L-threonine kinase